MEIDLTTPALLFSAISLIMLAYTNRFLSYAGLMRALKEQHQKSHSSVTAAQIANLRKRLYLTRAMQVTGIASLLLCVVSMFFIYIQLYLASVYIFGFALILLIISLAISVYESLTGILFSFLRNEFAERIISSHEILYFLS